MKNLMKILIEIYMELKNKFHKGLHILTNAHIKMNNVKSYIVRSVYVTLDHKGS